VIENGNQKLVYMTDTGYISQANMAYMKNADYYVIESNHNVRMLLQTDRTFTLIQRILGDTGHLSNEDSAMYLTELVGDKTKEIFLAHLSEEANAPRSPKGPLDH
jgi:phosphoribosyl 1,2-cyclic phosphodiesterase